MEAARILYLLDFFCGDVLWTNVARNLKLGVEISHRRTNNIYMKHGKLNVTSSSTLRNSKFVSDSFDVKPAYKRKCT